MRDAKVYLSSLVTPLSLKSRIDCRRGRGERLPNGLLEDIIFFVHEVSDWVRLQGLIKYTLLIGSYRLYPHLSGFDRSFNMLLRIGVGD